MSASPMSSDKNSSFSSAKNLERNFLHQKIAFLIATGVTEIDFISVQKILRSAGALPKFIGTDSGLVTSWKEKEWGHNYAVDLPLNQALAADFSMCIIPGGEKSAQKLSLSAHTKRFINGFILSSKPVLAINEGAALIERYAMENELELDLSRLEPVSLEASGSGPANDHENFTDTLVETVKSSYLVKMSLASWRKNQIYEVLAMAGERLHHRQAA